MAFRCEDGISPGIDAMLVQYDTGNLWLKPGFDEWNDSGYIGVIRQYGNFDLGILLPNAESLDQLDFSDGNAAPIRIDGGRQIVEYGMYVENRPGAGQPVNLT